MVQAERFLSVLFEPTDIVEIRLLPSGQQAFCPSYFKAVERWSEIESANTRGQNVYFGANPRSVAAGGKVGGKASDITLARCLFVDIDAEINLAAVEKRIEEANLPEPTAVVLTGHGFHVWWRLREPITDMAAWALMQRRLIAAMGSDHRIKDPPRIMRLPGTMNTKNQTWVMAELVRCAEPGQCVWPLEMFDSVLPPESRLPAERVQEYHGRELRGEIAHMSMNTLRFIVVGASVGERNQRLFNAACDMAGCGFSYTDACEKLIPAALKSGLDESETHRTIASAFEKPRTPARPSMGEGSPTGEFGEMPSRGWSALPEMGGGGDPILHAGGPRWGAEKGGNEREQAGTRLITFGSDWCAEPHDRPVFCNSVHINGTGDEKPWLRHIPAGHLAGALHELSGGWPRMAGGQLFHPRRRPKSGELPGFGSIDFIDTADELFAWVNGMADVHWTRKDLRSAEKHARSPLTKGEFLEYLRGSPPRVYESVEVLPHHPEVPSSWYVPCALPDDGGAALAELVKRLNAETDIDRVLCLAAILTGAWGGPCGARPAILFTSAHGRGVGKTSTAMIVADVWGLSIQFNAKDDWDKTMGRMLSPQAMNGRAVLIDNVKGRIDSDKLDALLTSPTIEGHRMYVGHTTRPNRLLTLITANQPRLSADLSARAVVIRIGAARWSDAGFAGWAGDHMARHRPAIVASCLSILKAAEAAGGGGDGLAPENRDRWVRWQTGPLAAACWAVSEGGPLAGVFGGDGAPTLNQCAAEVMRRRGDVDDDAASAEDLAEEIQKAIRLAGKNPETDSVHISHPVMAKILHASDTGEDMGVRQISSWIGGLAGTGALGPLAKSRPKDSGRGWRWSVSGKPPGWSIDRPGNAVPLSGGDDDLPI